MKIAVDFDGTVVEHRYPLVGKDIPHCQDVLKALVAKGHQLILFTMRSGDTLADAVKWYADRDIPLYGVNTSPGQGAWTQSPKAYAHIYIDDAALGCPLTRPWNDRPFVDWEQVELLLQAQGVL